MPVADLDAAADFYERLLGREPDLVPNSTEAAWQLHEGAWICLICEPRSAGTARHTLVLAELDGFLAGARDAGIEPGPIEPVGDGMRRSLIVDPDGNRLQVAAPVDGG